MMAAAVMVLLGLEVSDAFERIKAARGMDVPDTDEQRLWVEHFFKEQGRKAGPTPVPQAPDLGPQRW
jgi:hypothetical protein